MTAQYTIKDGQVEYEHHYTGRKVLVDADAGTLTPLNDPVVTGYFAGWHFAARDRNAVWFMTEKVPGADPSSFKYFHGGQCKWGVDRERIYCFYVDRRPRIKVIKSGDPNSFRFLKDEQFNGYMRQYAVDDKYVYYYGRRVLGAHPLQFGSVPKDQLSEGVADSDYYKDDASVFYCGRRVVGADPSTIRVFHMPGLGHYEYAFDCSGFYLKGRRFADPKAALHELDDIAAYVLARPEHRQTYWSRIYDVE